MRYGTVSSGVEAFGPAWKAMGYKCAFHAEIAPHPSAVLRYHFPEVPNLGDLTQIQANATTRVDLLAGGTPCQDFSVAGLRKGLAGKRGNLTLEFAGLAERLRPRWLVWENVPGVLSADGGRAFHTFLALLAELGYYAAYRVLDAQYFGVPQRRRRVFLVAYLGDWRPAAAVLFESYSLHRHSAPSRQARKDLAGTLTATTGGSGPAGRLELAATGYLQTAGTLTSGSSKGGGWRLGPDEAASGYLQTTGTLPAGYSKNGSPDVDAGLLLPVCATGQVTHTLTAEGHDASEDGTGRGTPIVAGTLCASKKSAGSATQQDAHAGLLVFDTKQITSKENRSRVEEGLPAPTLTKGMDPPAIAYQCHGGSVGELGVLRAGNGSMTSGVPFVASRETTQALTASYGKQPDNTASSLGPTLAHTESAVRRLTPLECERLMGYPDNWTQYGTKPNGTQYEVADGPRYQMCGNGWATPVANWIAERILLVENLLATPSQGQQTPQTPPPFSPVA